MKTFLKSVFLILIPALSLAATSQFNYCTGCPDFLGSSSGGGSATLPLPGGATNYVWITTGAVQPGAFNISSGTVNSTLYTSSFTVTGATTTSVGFFTDAQLPAFGPKIVNAYQHARLNLDPAFGLSGSYFISASTGSSSDSGALGGLIYLNATASVLSYGNSYGAGANTAVSVFPSGLYFSGQASFGSIIYSSGGISSTGFLSTTATITNLTSGVVQANASHDLYAGLVSLSTSVAGTLPVANGGTGLTSAFTATQPIMFNSGTGVFSATLISATTGFTGTLQAAQEPAHTGDVTNSAASLAMTAAANQPNIKTLAASSTTVSGAAGLLVTYGTQGSTLTLINSSSPNTLTISSTSTGVVLVSVSSAVAALPSDLLLTVSSSAATPIFMVSNAGNIISSGTVPSVSVCGTSPSMDQGSTNFSGKINVGSVTATACTLTFANGGFTTAPNCVVSDDNTGVTADITSISATAVVFGFSVSLASGHVWYICVGGRGG